MSVTQILNSFALSEAVLIVLMEIYIIICHFPILFFSIAYVNYLRN